MDLQEIKLNIEEIIHAYEKENETNLYHQNIKDLKWVLKMLNNSDFAYEIKDLQVQLSILLNTKEKEYPVDIRLD